MDNQEQDIEEGTNPQAKSSIPGSEDFIRHPSVPIGAESLDTISSSHARKSNKKRLIILLSLIVLGLATGATIYLLLKPDSQQTTRKQVDQAAEPQQTPNTEPKQLSQTEEQKLLERFITPTTGESWLQIPKTLPLQGYTSAEKDAANSKYPDETLSSIKYYEVGKRGDKTIIISITPGLGEIIELFEKSKDGKVALIARPDGDAVYNEDYEKSLKDIMPSNVAIDTTTHYDSLTIPRKLEIDKGYYAKKPAYPSLGVFSHPSEKNESNNPKTDIKKVGQSTIVKTEYVYADVKLTSIGYGLRTPLNTTVTLGYEPLETALSGYQWQRGNTPNDNIGAISKGCSGALYASVTRADQVTDADTQEVGRSPSGLSVHEFKNTNHPLLQKAYEEFVEFNKDSPSTPPAKFAGLPKDQFIKEHGVVLHKDKLGQWLIYARDELRPVYGCAKPVVYLYPQKEEMVNVRVGANVKISDPLYNPKTGWNALARPNGELTIDNKTYGSLFWEGPGWGPYPSIVSGTVVARGQAVDTIKSQLTQLGLNTQERTDFLEYWQDKLPNKPYVRLTWLTTSELNTLAPLYIIPKPDTIIRVFLDFAGLDQPVSLPTQKLTTMPRTGFTVVEWGGLSPTKLY